MTLQEREHAAVARALSLLHRIPSSLLYHAAIVVVLGLGAFWLAGREIKSALAWSEVAGKPIKLHPSKAEQSGDVIRVGRAQDAVCPAWQLEAATKKGRDQFAKLNIDPKRVNVLASYDIPRGGAAYGGTGATTIDKTTGAVENTFLAANPWLAWENRFGLGSGVVYTQQGIGATVHADFEPFSIRGPRGFRFFARVGADVDLLNGSAKPRASALLIMRRP